MSETCWASRLQTVLTIDLRAITRMSSNAVAASADRINRNELAENFGSSIGVSFAPDFSNAPSAVLYSAFRCFQLLFLLLVHWLNTGAVKLGLKYPIRRLLIFVSGFQLKGASPTVMSLPSGP